LVYADEVNILGRSVHTLKEDPVALVVASKEPGLQVIADKTKYMVMNRDQNVRRTHRIKMDNNSFARVEEFKYEYLGTTLTDQNSIQEEIESRLKAGNACYYLAKNLLSYRFMQKIKGLDLQNYKFAWFFVWVKNLVAHIEE
jgi:hypothetical protein